MGLSADFSARIDSVFAGGGVNAVARALVSGHAGIPRDASLMEQPRLIVCLQGRAAYELKSVDGTSKVVLSPRDGLFVAPGRWVRARPEEPYVLMGVVFYLRATRFYLMRGVPVSDGRVFRPAENHGVPVGLNENQRALCRLLEDASAGHAERYFHHVVECLLIAASGLLAQPVDVNDGGKARYTWQAACDFIQENLHRPLGRKDVARYLNVHPNHLSRLFRQFGRGTFTDYVQSRRLERARLLLEEPQLNVAEVARLSGFGSANYFTRVFRKRTERTPTRARRNG